MITSGIKVILRLLHQQFEGLQSWYYWWEEYMKYATEMSSGGIIYVYILSFMTIGSGIQVILRLVHEQFAAVLELPMRRIYEVCHWDGLKWHYIHAKFHDDQFRHSSNIRVISYYINNFRVCSIGITDGRDLRSMALRWPQASWYTYQISWRSAQVFRSCYREIHIQTHRQQGDLISTLLFFQNMEKG
jgi:hypothetical protein